MGDGVKVGGGSGSGRCSGRWEEKVNAMGKQLPSPAPLVEAFCK